MANVWAALTGQNGTTKALQSQIATQQSDATSQQGQQLALLAKQQGATDMSASQLNQPGIGRQMLQFQQRPGSTGGATTLGN